VRFSRRPVYLDDGVPSRTPYTGEWKWHHYSGLAFGLFIFTWLLSGLASLGALSSAARTEPTLPQLQAGARTLQGEGALIDLRPLTLDGMREAVSKIGAGFPVKELELQYVNRQPYYVAYRAPNA